MKILIADDEFVVALSLKMELERAGHHVIGLAATAEQALTMAQGEQPDLVFTEVDLRREREGVALARVLQQRHGTSCIFLTMQRDAARAAGDAAIGVVGKVCAMRVIHLVVDAVAALKMGRDPVLLPWDLELFAPALQHATLPPA